MAAVRLQLHTDRLLISWLGSLSCSLIKSVNGIDGAIASADCWVFSKWQENRHSSLRVSLFSRVFVSIPNSLSLPFHSPAFPLAVPVEHYTAGTELRRFIIVRKEWLRQTQCRSRWQMFPPLSSVTYLLTRYSPPFLTIHLYSGCVCSLLSLSGPHSHSRWKLSRIPAPSDFFLFLAHSHKHPPTHTLLLMLWNCCNRYTESLWSTRALQESPKQSWASTVQTSLLALFPAQRLSLQVSTANTNAIHKRLKLTLHMAVWMWLTSISWYLSVYVLNSSTVIVLYSLQDKWPLKETLVWIHHLFAWTHCFDFCEVISKPLWDQATYYTTQNSKKE